MSWCASSAVRRLPASSWARKKSRANLSRTKGSKNGLLALRRDCRQDFGRDDGRQPMGIEGRLQRQAPEPATRFGILPGTAKPNAPYRKPPSSHPSSKIESRSKVPIKGTKTRRSRQPIASVMSLGCWAQCAEPDQRSPRSFVPSSLTPQMAVSSRKQCILGCYRHAANSRASSLPKM